MPWSIICLQEDRRKTDKLDFVSTFSTQATSTRSVSSPRHWKSQTLYGRSFRSTNCLWDSARMQRWQATQMASAVPNSDMTAGDQERATFFVNFIAKSGSVAQNTWTAAAAPQEELYTWKEWDKHNMLGNQISQLEHRWSVF